jgi:hypothetical protein
VQNIVVSFAFAADFLPSRIGSAVVDMLGDKALCEASRSFASGVSGFGELSHAVDLIQQAV